MAKYVDGFVLVVPKNKTEEYKKLAEGARDAWMRNGALQYYECRGDDLIPQQVGDLRARAFDDMAGATGDDDVWFSFIVFESKEHRDRVNAKVMEEMEQQSDGEDMMSVPFDMKQLAYGGFRVEVES